MGSYQLQWGGVSGFIEPADTSLLQRALLEAQEEVGLTKLRHVRCGRPLLVDGGPHRQFAVHPVLLDTTSDQPIRLNWENVAFQWVEPGALRGLDHVPQLPETADRVLPGPALQAALQWLEADRAHGAAELARVVLDAMQGLDHMRAWSQQTRNPRYTGVVHALQQDTTCTASHARDTLLNAAYHLSTCRPGMASLANAALACVQGVAEACDDVHAVLHSVQTVCGWRVGRVVNSSTNRRSMQSARSRQPQQTVW